MKIHLKASALAAAAGAIAIAVPAAAHPGPGNHPAKPDHPSKSHKCKPHNVGYIESGTIDATTPSMLNQNTDGTWSGTLVVDVTRTNHWAKAVKGTTVTETLTDAKVRFGGGASGFTSGERVQLIGKLAAVAKKCAAPSSPASPVFRMVVVHPAKS